MLTLALYMNREIKSYRYISNVRSLKLSHTTVCSSSLLVLKLEIPNFELRSLSMISSRSLLQIFRLRQPI